MTCSGRSPPVTAQPRTRSPRSGLPARPDLSDEQVRAAWRAIATATHPDRADGGDPARVRRRVGRLRHAAHPVGTVGGIRRPDRHSPGPAPPAGRPAARSGAPASSPWRAMALVPARVRHGRPARLAARVVAAAALTFVVAALRCGHPAGGGAAHRHRDLAGPVGAR